jgi:hypothetical protein
MDTLKAKCSELIKRIQQLSKREQIVLGFTMAAAVMIAIFAKVPYFATVLSVLFLLFSLGLAVWNFRAAMSSLRACLLYLTVTAVLAAALLYNLIKQLTALIGTYIDVTEMPFFDVFTVPFPAAPLSVLAAGLCLFASYLPIVLKGEISVIRRAIIILASFSILIYTLAVFIIDWIPLLYLDDLFLDNVQANPEDVRRLLEQAYDARHLLKLFVGAIVYPYWIAATIAAIVIEFRSNRIERDAKELKEQKVAHAEAETVEGH